MNESFVENPDLCLDSLRNHIIKGLNIIFTPILVDSILTLTESNFLGRKLEYLGLRSPENRGLNENFWARCANSGPG